MSIIATVLHVVACFVLIVVVLLQTGKGADIGAVFGGSSQTIFGSSGAGNLLTRLTTWTAVIFMVTSLFLTWSSTQHLTKSIADTLPDEPPPLAAPIDAGTAPATAAAPAEGTATAPAGEAAPAADAGAPVEAAPAQNEGAAAQGAVAPAQDQAAPAAAEKPADDKSASAAPAAGAATAPAGQEAAPAQP